MATIDYNVPQRICALHRGHIVFFFLPASQIECQLLERVGKYVVEFFRQADGIKEFLLQSDAHKYSLMTHS